MQIYSPLVWHSCIDFNLWNIIVGPVFILEDFFSGINMASCWQVTSADPSLPSPHQLCLLAGWGLSGRPRESSLGLEMGRGREGLSCFSFHSSVDGRPCHLLCGHLCRSGKAEAPDPGRALPRPSRHSHPPGPHDLCRFFYWHGGISPRQPDTAENRKALFHDPGPLPYSWLLLYLNLPAIVDGLWW